MSSKSWLTLTFVGVAWLMASTGLCNGGKPIDAGTVAEAIAIPVAWLQGDAQNVALDVKVMSKGKSGWEKQGNLSLTDLGARGFRVTADGEGRKVVLLRTAEKTEVVLPNKKLVYVASGAVNPENALDLRQIAQRMLAQDPQLTIVAAVASTMSAPDLADMLVGMFPDEMKVSIDGAGVKHVTMGDPGDEAEVLVKPGRGITQVNFGADRVVVDLRKAGAEGLTTSATKGFVVKTVDRNAIERILSKGLTRIGESGMGEVGRLETKLLQLANDTKTNGR